MPLNEKAMKIRSRSDGPDLDVSQSGTAFVISIGPVAVALDRTEAEELVMLLEDALLRSRTEIFFFGVSN